MPPLARRSTSRPSAQLNIDPTVFGALSIAELRSHYVQHGIPFTGVRRTLQRRRRELNNPPSTKVQNVHEHQPAAPNNDETAALRQERPELTDGQMQTIQQLKGHSRLVHMRIGNHFIANLHNALLHKKRARKSEKRI